MSGLKTEVPQQAGTQQRRAGFGPTIPLVALMLLLGLVVRPMIGPAVSGPRVEMWSTIFVALMVQALPFLVLGVVVSGLIAAFLPPRLITRWLPSNRFAAVGAASAAGTLLPGCECGSVPISGRLMARGAAPAAALAFMLAAPAVNPIVVVSTAIAFPGQPELVVARFLASMVTAIGVGLLWMRFGRSDLLVARLLKRAPETEDRFELFTSVTRHDLLHAGGFLVIGAAVAAGVQTVVPRAVIDTLAGSILVSILIMTVLAIVLSICSEADAFVAASLSQFPTISLLAFMVVGPAVDLKLVAMQAGVFGREFAVRFAPLSLAVALVSTIVFGVVLL